MNESVWPASRETRLVANPHEILLTASIGAHRPHGEHMTTTAHRSNTMSLKNALLLAVCAFFAVTLSAASAAHADTCTFFSNTITYNEGPSGQTLRFSWNNSTGAVLQNGTSCSASGTGTAFWNDLENGVTYNWCGNSADPGTVQSGFTLGVNSRKNVQLNMKYNGNTGYEINGQVHTRGGSSPLNAIFSGAYYGTSNALLVGYGTVTCTTP